MTSAGYATWDLYQAYYGKITDQQAFEKLNYRVSRILDAFTGGRAQAATGQKASRLNDCACKLIDVVSDLDENGIGRGVTSVSNDGYSETYAATEPADVTKVLRRVAFQELSGTGLMGAM